MDSKSDTTPNRPKNDGNVNFTPVFVRQSPVSRTPQKGNLTGNPRIVRDKVADLYNLIQKWNSCHLYGSDILAKISSLKLATMDPAAQSESDIYPEGIQYYCDLLENTCKDTAVIVSKMEKCSSQLRGMCELEHHTRTSVEVANPSPMFLTWPVGRFAQVSSNIVSRYSTELEVKNLVLEGVCHCKSRETLMFHVAAWAHQPTMIDENAAQCEMEAMLIETGHR